MISWRALAPLSKSSGSNPDPIGSSADAALRGSDLASLLWFSGGGEGDDEEGKKRDRNRLSACARLDAADNDATAAATATHDDSFDAAIGQKTN